MRDDELQVLGTEKDVKKDKLYNRLLVGIFASIALLLIGTVVYHSCTSETDEKIYTGKVMGESTIVPELQVAVDSFLQDEMYKIGALQGQVIVMEVETGEIKALVGLECNFEGKYQPCANYAFQQEPGSLMTTASLLAALETGNVKLSDTFDTGEGIMPIGNDLEMKDHNWHRGGYGAITLEKALMMSSNIGIGKAVVKAFGNNQQAFFDALDDMSFGKHRGVEGLEKLNPQMYSSPKDSDWIPEKIWWSAIGYERKMAPIQILTFYNAIANNGKMIKPMLKTGVIEVINSQIASEASLDSIQMAIEHVVSLGLGKTAGSKYTRVAGKSGTVQVKEHYGYGDEPVYEFQVSFCGYFPADKPKYSLIVSMNKIGYPASGGLMAGAVFHNIVDWMLEHKMVPAGFSKPVIEE